MGDFPKNTANYSKTDYSTFDQAHLQSLPEKETLRDQAVYLPSVVIVVLSSSSTMSLLNLLPPFSGRFDEAVIEERRNATEAMLLFATSIPALYNSPQLKDFFRVRLAHTHAHTCV